MGEKRAFRARLFRAIHAEGIKRGIDHDALRDMCRTNFGVHSLSEMTDDNLYKLYRSWTNRGLKRRKHEAGPGCQPVDKHEGFRVLDKLQMVASEDLVILAQEFALAGMSEDSQKGFIRRQLRGRDIIRTRGDWGKVINGLRAINKRERRAS